YHGVWRPWGGTHTKSHSCSFPQRHALDRRRDQPIDLEGWSLRLAVRDDARLGPGAPAPGVRRTSRLALAERNVGVRRHELANGASADARGDVRFGDVLRRAARPHGSLWGLPHPAEWLLRVADPFR